MEYDMARKNKINNLERSAVIASNIILSAFAGSMMGLLLLIGYLVYIDFYSLREAVTTIGILALVVSGCFILLIIFYFRKIVNIVHSVRFRSSKEDNFFWW